LRPAAPGERGRGEAVSDLPFVGYHPLRPGRIHLYCHGCGLKRSNAERLEYDPPSAVLADVLCEKCSSGCMEPSTVYRGADGREVEWWSRRPAPGSTKGPEDGR
jgi:hypothetical protein